MAERPYSDHPQPLHFTYPNNGDHTVPASPKAIPLNQSGGTVTPHLRGRNCVRARNRCYWVGSTPHPQQLPQSSTNRQRRHRALTRFRTLSPEEVFPLFWSDHPTLYLPGLWNVDPVQQRIPPSSFKLLDYTELGSPSYRQTKFCLLCRLLW